MNSLTFLYTFYFISIFICILAFIITLAFVLPLQIKEAMVKNGLSKLRKLMLMSGIVMIIMEIAAILSLTLRFFVSGDLARYSTVILIFIFSLGMLAFAIIKRTIYKQQFVEKHEHHL